MEGATLDRTVVRQAIDQANRRFMERFNAGDVAAAAAGVYTRDARVLPPGAALVRGRDGIVAFWRGAAEALGLQRVELTTLELDIHPGGAHEVGRADLTLVGGEQRAVGKYVVVWKEEDGEWRWDVDIWNMDA